MIGLLFASFSFCQLIALVSEKAFFLILGLSSLAVFATYFLQTVAVMIGHRRGTIPAPEPGTFDLGRARVPVVHPRHGLLHPGVRGADLPAAVRRQRLRVPRPYRARRALGGDRAAQAAGQTGEAGPDYAKTHTS